MKNLGVFALSILIFSGTLFYWRYKQAHVVPLDRGPLYMFNLVHLKNDGQKKLDTYLDRADVLIKPKHPIEILYKGQAIKDFDYNKYWDYGFVIKYASLNALPTVTRSRLYKTKLRNRLLAASSEHVVYACKKTGGYSQGKWYSALDIWP